MLLLVYSFMAVYLTGVDAEAWNYADKGPSTWNSNSEFPNCALRRQSPVNIELSNTLYSDDLTPIDRELFAGRYRDVTLSNNGHTIGIGFDGWTIPAGTANFTDDYKAVNLHLHWGTETSGGSEHTFNNQRSFCELHFVHYNTKYGSLSNAVDKPDGLAVLGIMAIRAGTVSNPAFQQLLDPVLDGNVTHKGDSTTLPSISFKNLFPRTSLYYRYLGSLTTPGCLESVTWTVFNDVIYVSEAQAETLMTRLFEYKRDAAFNRPIVANFRPPQPLYGRRVYRSLPRASGSQIIHISNFILLALSLVLSACASNLL